MSYQQQKFKEIADKIREKTGESGLIKPSEFANKIEDVFAAGAASVPPGGEGYDEGVEAGKAQGKAEQLNSFWKSYQNSGGRTQYSYAFNYMPANMFYPLYTIKSTAGQLNQAFRYFNNSSGMIDNDFDLTQRLNECGVSLDFSNNTNAQLVFAFCKTKSIPLCDFSKLTSADRTFYDIKNLEKIEKIISNANLNYYGANGTTFYKLPNLKYVRFEGIVGGVSNIDISGSPLLEVDSITNEEGTGLFDCLADHSSDTSKTWSCAIGTYNLAKLTDAQKAIATEKGWTLS